MQIQNPAIFLFIFLLNIQKSCSKDTPKRTNIYRWIAQNSYICDPTLLNRNSHRFLAPRESLSLKCSCGDPLVTKSACGRRNVKEKPKCFRLPDACLQEYTVIFTSGGNRMSKPLNPRPGLFLRTTIKKRPTPAPVARRKSPKIIKTLPVTTVLRLRKTKKAH